MTPPLDAQALRAALPPMDGTLHLPGLAAPVEVIRDEWGIPHIRAAGEADAWFALGAVHAQDRLFQMELNRRRALGRSAEWLGAAAAEADALARRLEVEAASRRDFAAASPQARAMLESYAAGVNAFLASGAPPPVEYALLDAVPEPWEPWHPIAVMRRLGLLMGSVWFKLWRAAALSAVGPEGAAKLRYDDGGGDLLCIPPGVEAERWAADLAALAPAIGALLEASGADVTGGGSNNWAVGPSRSTTGRPVLAGDPHRVFEMPNMYAQHHLACDAFDVVGLTVPGVPGFPHFAHNGRVAYCVTHAFMDIHDLYLERFDEAGANTLTAQGWHPVSRRMEVVRVRGAADREVAVVETVHGPVIAGDPATGTALALKSVQFAETDHSFDCLPRMLRATGVEALFQATRGWGVIDHNLVAADVDGHIGHLVRAKVPRRRRENGWLPVPGWLAAHEWNGWIAPDAMPVVLDPPGAVIVTANNRVVADSHPDYLCTDCHPPHRARRIADLLAEGPHVPEAAGAVHGDVLSPIALLIQARLASMEAPTDPAQAALRARLLEWDGRMEAASPAPTAYIALRRALTSVLAERSGLAGLAGHPWLSPSPGVAPVNQLWWALPALLRAEDASLLAGWTWPQAMAVALSRAATTAPTPWGEAHRPRFAHPLSSLFPEAAGLLDAPSRPIGGDGDTVMAHGVIAGGGMAAAYGPLARYAFDVGDWEACRWAVFHGVSGHPGSPHYADQNAAWSDCAMVPMRYGWTEIEAAATARQVLRP